MSCHHHYYYPHGCGDWPAPTPEWHDIYGYRPRRYRDDVVLRDDGDEDFADERPWRRGGERGRRRRAGDIVTEGVTAASLQSRAEALRDELVRIEADLAKLSTESSQASET